MPNNRKDARVKENETELQPDPLLKEGRASNAWLWTVGIALIAVIAIFFFAVGHRHKAAEIAGAPQHAAHVTTGANN